MKRRLFMLALASASAWAKRRNLLLEPKSAAPNDGGIVFVGSSIFAYWARLAEQMAPLPVLNRGVPGAVTLQVLGRIENLALRYRPRIVVYYCGSNDISAGEAVAEITKRTQAFVQELHAKLPETWFFYTSVHKAPEKSDRWDQVDAVNRAMQKFTSQERRAGFIDWNPVLFDRQGRLREELFLPDGLHFRPEAYVEFAAVVKPVLEKTWNALT
jgi:lysophospholipase L1-like esterase